MNDRSFFLKPFPSDRTEQDFQITCSIGRHFNILYVSYALLGPIAELGLPAPVKQPFRKSSLWEETCFELFLGIKNSPRYWEFNMSPSGHWNVYRFNAYRQGMQEEPAITSLPFSINSKPDSFRLSLEIDLDKIVPVDQALEAGVSAVIRPLTGPMTYLALVHQGPQADFHRRDGFIISL